MNAKRLLFAAAFFVLFSSQLSFGQMVCFMDVEYPNATYDANDCPISATVLSPSASVQVVLDPNPIQWPGMCCSISVSGTLGGDLAANDPNAMPPQFSFPCQQVQPDDYPVLWANPMYSPGVHLVTATISACNGYTGGPWSATLAIVIPPPVQPNPPDSTPCSVQGPFLIDPVASGLLSGNVVTQNAAAVAAATSPRFVSGAAADGVTQVIVEVPTGNAGDTVQLTVLNENGQTDTVANNGGLFLLGGTPGSASSSLKVTAQGTSTPMAYAVLLAPANYYRGTQDAATYQRALTLQAQCTNASGSPTTASKLMWTMRPPVLLVHGLWSSPDAWNNFIPVNNESLWALMHNETANYNVAVPGVTATSPSYLITPAVNANALGFAFNVQTVLNATQHLISDFEALYTVAAVQADVVAHSMGGDIARLMPSMTTGPTPFASPSNYGLGPVHKLITIGTPHQATPLAVDLLPSALGDSNACVRDVLATFSKPSFQTVTFGTATVNGAVGDIAAAPANLPATEPFPMAYLAGSTNAANLQNIDSTFSTSYWLRSGCLTYFGSGLAYDLSPTLWNNVFGGAANDGVVPVSSQLNNTTSTTTNTFQGVIHSPGIEQLNFAAPSEVNPQSGIPDAVVNLLNEATNGSDFH